MKVTAVLKKFGKYAPGVVFELPSKIASVFIRVGKLQAVEEEEASIPAKQGYKTRALKAAE